MLAVGCFRNPVTSQKQTRLISEAAERNIGEETQKNILKEYAELKDPVLSEYVSSVGLRLTAVCDRPDVDYRFTVLDTDMINAFAAPGGFLFITRGLLEEMQSEAEMASVLGHEIVHVAGWHSVGMIQKQMGYGALTTLGAIASGFRLGPEAMLMVAQTGQLFTNLYLLGYSRDHELEADRVGIRYMISAGYDPHSALTFYERLNTLEKRDGAERWEPYLLSHPPTEDRIRLAKAYIDRPFFAQKKGERGEIVYQKMKDRLPRVAQEDRGEVVGRRFTQERYGVSLSIPNEWSWEPKSAQAVVAFRREGGQAWGELRRVPLVDSSSSQDVAERFAKDRGWVFIQGRRVLYPAGYGFLGQFYGPGALGGVYIFRVFVTERPTSSWLLFCAAAPDRTWDYMIPFEQILRSFELN